MSKVTHKIEFNSIRIFINEVEHIHFYRDLYVHRQTWYGANKKYFIEISFKEGAELLLEYDNEELWKKIVQCLTDSI